VSLSSVIRPSGCLIPLHSVSMRPLAPLKSLGAADLIPVKPDVVLGLKRTAIRIAQSSTSDVYWTDDVADYIDTRGLVILFDLSHGASFLPCCELLLNLPELHCQTTTSPSCSANSKARSHAAARFDCRTSPPCI
jgi:hypothetical protein